MKKIILGCSIALLAAAGFVTFMFYLVFKPKYRDVSEEVPFSQIIKTTLTTKTETLLMEYPVGPKDEIYTYHLEDGTSYGMETEMPAVVTLPVGTKIIMDKAELHTGRVSGTTGAYLYGKVYSEAHKREYLFQYSWGEYRSLYEDKPYWTFEQSFWQDIPLKGKFYIEVP